MSSYIGDFVAGAVVRKGFNTATITGSPITLVGATAAVYKDGSLIESTSGVTLVTDFDGHAGYHLLSVDTAADGAFYAPGADFRVVLTSGTVDGTNVAGSEILSFSLANRSALRPTVAGRDLDVDTQGKVDLVQAFPANFSAMAINGSGQVSIGQAFPANFASLAIAGDGKVTAGSVTDKSGYALAASGLDAIPIEVGVNARQALAPILAAAAGSVSGAGTGTVSFTGGNVATTRIVATTDANGNRTSVTLTLPT